MNTHKPVKCPIPGCNLAYSRGILGWHTHVEREDAHPFWNKGAPSSSRKELFVKEFPDFFLQAVGHQTPTANRILTPVPPPLPQEAPVAKKRSTPPEALAEALTDPRAVPEGADALSMTDLLHRVLDLLIILESKAIASTRTA